MLQRAATGPLYHGEKMGVMSFTRTELNDAAALTMWAYYGSKGEGMVVEVDLSNKVFEPFCGSGLGGSISREVSYSEERPLAVKDSDQAVKEIPLRKSKAWEGENEYRIVITLDNFQQYLENNDSDTHRTLLALPWSAIVSITLGPNFEPKRVSDLLKCLDNRGDKDEIVGKMYIAELDPENYAIKVVPLDKSLHTLPYEQRGNAILNELFSRFCAIMKIG